MSTPYSRYPPLVVSPHHTALTGGGMGTRECGLLGPVAAEYTRIEIADFALSSIGVCVCVKESAWISCFRIVN